MVAVKFYGEYDKTFSLDVASVIEAEFIILGWINSQKKYSITHKIDLENIRFSSRSKITIDNFHIIEGEQYLRNMLIEV